MGGERIDLLEWLPILVVLVLGAISPGPSLAVLLRNTLEGGARRGVACGAGHGIGFGIYAFIAVSGIAVVKASGYARPIEVLGGIFLLFLAAQGLRAKSSEPAHTDSQRQGFVEGFLIAFLNPKILAFQLAVFSQFIQPDFTVLERALVAGTALVIDGAWYIAVATVIGGTRLLDLLREREDALSKLMAVILGCYGIWILLA